ncbi:hypothetical protein I3843_10G132100 [Carya illinoinensis]|nr:hypothetical protein I3843_10G132100 [Carya illinoinensis]
MVYVKSSLLPPSFRASLPLVAYYCYLSVINECNGLIYCSSLFTKPPVTTTRKTVTTETLKDYLSCVLVPYYPLTGQLHWIHGGYLDLHCNAKGVQLLEAYSET